MVVPPLCAAEDDEEHQGTESIVNGDAFEFVDPGPLRIRDQFMLGMGLLAFEPTSARVLERGQWQFDFVFTVSNDFVHAGSVEDVLDDQNERRPITLDFLRSIEPDRPSEGRFLVDGEVMRGALALRRGLGSNLQLEIAVQAVQFSGGFLDAGIEGFHDLAGLNQAGREAILRDQFAVYLDPDNDFLLWVSEEPEWGLGDAVLGLKADLFPERRSRSLELAVEGKVKIPLGDSDRFTSSESIDFGTQLLATRYFRKTSVHGNLGAVYLGSWDKLNLGRQVKLSGMLAVEQTLGSKNTLLFQATVSESPFTDLDLKDFEGLSTLFTVGYKHRIGNQVLFLAATENSTNFDLSPDIGVHVGVTSRF